MGMPGGPGGSLPPRCLQRANGGVRCSACLRWGCCVLRGSGCILSQAQPLFQPLQPPPSQQDPAEPSPDRSSEVSAAAPASMLRLPLKAAPLRSSLRRLDPAPATSSRSRWAPSGGASDTCARCSSCSRGRADLQQHMWPRGCGRQRQGWPGRQGLGRTAQPPAWDSAAFFWEGQKRGAAAPACQLTPGEARQPPGPPRPPRPAGSSSC